MTERKSPIPTKAEAAALVAEQDALRKRAAKQRAALAAEAQPDQPMVQCRVLPMGHERVSMGLHVAGIGEAHYDRGETFSAPADVAQALEQRGYVEVLTEAPAA